MKKIPKKKRKVTELYFNEYDGTAEIYTYNTKLKKRLTAYAATYPVALIAVVLVAQWVILWF